MMGDRPPPSFLQSLAARPVITSFNLTTQCNIRCTYCQVADRRERMPAEVVTRGLDALAALGEPFGVVPFGGEPLLRWELFRDLVEGAAARGAVLSNVCTNGLLVREERLAFMAAHDMGLTLSLDGVGAANDRVRQHHNGQGTFGEFVAVLPAVEAHYPLGLNLRVTITPGTAAELPRTVQWAGESWMGARRDTTICFMPTGCDPWDAAALAALAAAMRKTTDILIALERAGRRVTLVYNECVPAGGMDNALTERNPAAGSCLAGAKMLGIDCDGAVYPCHTALELDPVLKAPLRLGDLGAPLAPLAERAADYVTGGITQNPYGGCLLWNWIAHGHPLVPCPVYRVAFAAFLELAERVGAARDPGQAGALRAARLARLAAHDALAAAPPPPLGLGRRGPLPPPPAAGAVTSSVRPPAPPAPAPVSAAPAPAPAAPRRRTARPPRRPGRGRAR
jgi:MoaA/NifB/PqqE/SkfB family radical SAM enzyme